MNPSARPLTHEKYDSLEKSYDSLKNEYKTLLNKKKEILRELLKVKSDLVTSLANDSKNKSLIEGLKEKQRAQGTIFACEYSSFTKREGILKVEIQCTFHKSGRVFG